MEQYENYKDSGIEWIGKIPEHWKIKKIKYIISYTKGRNPKELKTIWNDNFEIYLAMDYLRENPKQIYYVEDPENYILVNDNDILLLWDGSNAGEFIKSKKGVLSSTMAILKVENIQKEYSFYFLKTFEKYLKESTIGMGIPHVNSDEFKNSLISIPLVEEQVIIADFLDRKTAEIDKIIANKQKLIALYEEEKQAIINQAVTKGLDPNVKMKDSCVEWLGEIPAHWEVKKLNYCFGQIGSGTTPTSGKPEYYENGEFNWLQTGDLNDSEIIETSKKITQKALDDNSTLRFYPLDSIVIAMYGATIGKTGILKIESTTNQACCVLSKPRNMFPKFVFYWFNAVKKHIISLSYGGGQPNINQEQIRSLKIQQPPIDEQKNVVEYIENELSRLSVIIEKFNKQIDLLQEYRTTLISEVVTGKIKVPNTIEA